MMNALMDAHQTAKAQFDKLAGARSTLDAVRRELDTLSKLGDMVTPEDVIKGAGKLVSVGLSPLALAKLLSDMPSDGQQLQAWLAQHEMAVSKQEAQLTPVLDAARHQLGVTGLRVLTANHFGAPMGPQQGAAAPDSVGNALVPSPGPVAAPQAPQGAADV